MAAVASFALQGFLQADVVFGGNLRLGTGRPAWGGRPGTESCGEHCAWQGVGLKLVTSLCSSLEARHFPVAGRGTGMARDGAARCLSQNQAGPSMDDLTGQIIVVVGLGASGRAAARLALARGAAEVIGLDTNQGASPLQGDGARVRTELGPHRLETLLGADRLVLSPGVPPSQPEVAAALEAGVGAVSELAFAAEALPAGLPVAAVSGTNGKSTVTTFTGQLLKQAGLRTFVGGNLGTPLAEAALAFLEAPSGHPAFQVAVVEVSSYQLEFPGTFHPKVAVILNLTPDHLERHGSMEAYGAAKCRLFHRMESSDLAVLPQGDPLLVRLARAAGGAGQRAWVGALPGVQVDARGERAIVEVPGTAPVLLDLRPLRCVGRHNAENAAIAALLAHALHPAATQEVLQAALPRLQPPPHRMQQVCEDANGVLWINDSKATNIEATMVGVAGVLPRRAVVLLGGQAKAGKGGEGLGFSRLVPALNAHRAVLAFGASGPAIEAELLGAGLTVPCVRVAGLLDAVHTARTLAQPGDAVLLSPACASFDEFTNFAHRGQAFEEAARSTA